MENLFKNRATAIALTMALALVAFSGMLVLAEPEPVPETLDVIVTDTFEPATDGNAYTILDTFEWFVPGTGMNLSNEFNVTLTVGPLGPFDLRDDSDMTYWNETREGWVFEFAPDSAVYVGDHDWMVVIDNGTASVNDTGMITIWHPVLFNTDHPETLMLTEDEMFAWNLTEAFLPVMDQAGNFLSFGVGPEGFPEGWTFTPITDDDGYPWWEVTPPMDFEGSAMVNVTAQDTNGIMAYKEFELNVIGVNDPPMIEYLMVDGVQLEPEMWNYTWMEDDMNMSEIRNVVNITMDEEEMIEVMVSAMDVETMRWNLTYDLDLSDAPVMVENQLNETNETIPYNFTITGEVDEYGTFWGTLNVSDVEDAYDMIYIQLMIDNVNDPPMGEFGPEYQERFEVLTEEEINVSVSVSDDDMDDLTIIWKIDGEVVEGWNEPYFLYNFSEEGLYNVSAEVTDGVATTEIGYFHVNVTIANTAPEIIDVQAYPVGIDLFDLADFWAEGNVEEGKDVTLTCTAMDAEDDELTYTWTHDQDTSWTMAGAEVVVPAEDLEVGLSYTFTCTVSDGLEEVSDQSNTINIVEEDEDPNVGGFCIAVIIIIGIILLVIVIIIILVVKKGKKKEEEVPEETEMGGEYEEGMEEPMPEEGMEEPMPEEQPMGEEMPEEMGMEEQPMTEEAPAEEPQEPLEQEQPVPPQPPQQPEVPQQPAPPQQ